MKGHVGQCSRVLRRCNPEKSSYSAMCHSQTRLNRFFSNCHLKKTCGFYKPQFGRISLNISLSDSVLETKRLQAKELNSTCGTVKFVNYCGMWNDCFFNSDALTFLTATVL